MNRQLANIVGVALLSLAGYAVGGDKGAPKIEGTWIAIAANLDGKPLPDDVVEKIALTLVIKEGKYKVTVEGKVEEEGGYKIDSAVKPATLDLDITVGKNKGTTQVGIIMIEGDKMTVALAQPGSKDRPKSFDPGAGLEVTVLKRKK